MNRLLLVPLALLLLAAAAEPQKPVVIPGLGESIEVSIVNVDVIVTDAKGHRVRGLTRDDFQLFENGKPQAISNFAEYSDAAPAPPDGSVTAQAPETPAAQKRTLVLLLEPFRMGPERTRPFIDGLKALVAKTVREGDSVSFVEFDRKLITRVPSTDDVAEVSAALDQFGRRCTGVYYDPAVTVQQDANAIKAFESDAAAFGAKAKLAPKAVSDESVGEVEAKLAASQAHLEMKRRVAAINTVIESMAAHEGRKILVLSPHRLGQYAGAEFYYSLGFSVLPPNAKRDFDDSALIRSISRNANAAGVTVYPLFAPGMDEVAVQALGANATPAPDRVNLLANEMQALSEIAEQTGGIAQWGTVNIAGMLPQVAADATQYYSLAYRTTGGHEDRASNVMVKTKNASLEVRSRREFVEKSEDSHMRDRVVAALSTPPLPTDLAISASTSALKRDGRREIVPLSVTIPVAAIAVVPDGSKFAGAFSVYVVTGADDGAISDITRQTQKFELTEAETTQMKAGHFTYNLDLLVTKASTHLAVGVIDEVSKSYGLVGLPINR